MPAKQIGEYPPDWKEIATEVKDDANWCCVRCQTYHNVDSGHCLTVHHFDGNKSNGERWNLMALCQRCHLSVQARVDPQIPLMFEPRVWAMPYIAGFYESAGGGIPGPLYNLMAWVLEYGHDWPSWAPGQHFAEMNRRMEADG